MKAAGKFRLSFFEEHPSLTLGMILFVAFILRLIAVSTRGIWYDDAFSILLSRQSFQEIVQGTAADTMPPLYYFLLHGWMWFSQSIVFIRSLNILLSLVVVYLIYRLGTDLGGARVGLIAAALTSISPFQIYHAQEIRMYVMLELGLIGYFWMFWRISQTGQPSRSTWISFVLFGLLAMYSHNLAVFSLVSVDFLLILRREWKKLGQVLLAQLLVLVGFLPWLFLVPGQIEKIQTAFWTPRPGLIEVLQAMMQLIGSMPQPTLVTAVIAVIATQVVVGLVIQIWTRRHDLRVQYLAILFALPPFLLFVASYLMRPVYVPRAFIASGLCLYLLIALACLPSEPETGKRKSAIIEIVSLVLVLISSIISLPYQYQYDDFPRSPFSEMADRLARRCPPSDCLVLHDNKLSFFPMVVYKPTLTQRFLADTPGSHNDTLALQTQKAIHLEAYPTTTLAVSGYQKVIFVTLLKAESEYKQMGYPEHPRITELKQTYRQLDSFSVGDLVCYEFSQ